MSASAIEAHAALAAPPGVTAQWSNDDLQGFFDALQDARSPEEASHIETDIARMLARSESPTVELLLDRAQRAQKSGDLATARELLNQAVALAPGFAEGWRRRGEVAALQRDFADAIDDLGEAVKLQPKHFLALQSLGKLHEGGPDPEAAIAYYQSALALDPWLTLAREGLKRLGAPQSQIGAAPPVSAGDRAAEAAPLGKGGV
ncbi:MAG: tetratricopeptide repeat protein [Caulobacterales bacterium]